MANVKMNNSWNFFALRRGRVSRDIDLEHLLRAGRKRETKKAANAATHAHQERPGEEEDLCCF